MNYRELKQKLHLKLIELSQRMDINPDAPETLKVLQEVRDLRAMQHQLMREGKHRGPI